MQLTGRYENEVIQYTGRAGENFTGCTRGTSAPFRGLNTSGYNSRNASYRS